MNGKGSVRRPPRYVPRCTTVRHVFVAGAKVCQCGQRGPTPPRYIGNIVEVDFNLPRPSKDAYLDLMRRRAELERQRPDSDFVLNKAVITGITP